MAVETVQQYWDEALLLVPRMQLSEINELEIKDYCGGARCASGRSTVGSSTLNG